MTHVACKLYHSLPMHCSYSLSSTNTGHIHCHQPSFTFQNVALQKLFQMEIQFSFLVKCFLTRINWILCTRERTSRNPKQCILAFAKQFICTSKNGTMIDEWNLNAHAICLQPLYVLLKFSALSAMWSTLNPIVLDRTQSLYSIQSY